MLKILVSNWSDKEQYMIDYENVKLYLWLGFKLKKFTVCCNWIIYNG